MWDSEETLYLHFRTVRTVKDFGDFRSWNECILRDEIAMSLGGRRDRRLWLKSYRFVHQVDKGDLVFIDVDDQFERI